MKSDTISVKTLFQERRQFCVPFYQRSYVWTLENQWERLWEDVEAKANANLEGSGKVPPHFLGAVVLEPEGTESLIGVGALHIIDGQQRLTTLQFLLAATAMVLRERSLTEFLTVVESCLRNGNTDNMRNAQVEVYKLWPTYRDRRDYQSAMSALDITSLREAFPDHFTAAFTLRQGKQLPHPPALAAIWNFAVWVREWLGPAKADDEKLRANALVTAALQNLHIVSIILGDDDDAQVIFESLNGNAEPLHATDLIRNFIFLRADRQGEDSQALYDAHWSQFEADEWQAKQRRGRLERPRLEWFMSASLQAVLREDVDLPRLYVAYQKFAASPGMRGSSAAQLRALSKFAVSYRELSSGIGSTPIAKFGRRIREFDVSTIFPLALLIGSASDTSDDEKAQMFDVLMSYLVRRSVCGLTTKNYNNVFMSILRSLDKQGVTLEALTRTLQSVTGDISRWPGDEEFLAHCKRSALYPGRIDAPRMRTILIELEMQLRSAGRPEEKVPPELSSLDIDHILPEAWHTFWALPDSSMATKEQLEAVTIKGILSQELLGQDALIGAREKAKRTLGNLTLLNLSVNREAKNYEFMRKRDLLIKNTVVRLNVPLLARELWDETGIADRSDELAAAALALWPGPLIGTATAAA